jgi:hypothetical protein
MQPGRDTYIIWSGPCQLLDSMHCATSYSSNGLHRGGIPEEPIQVPPESLLYTVPDDYLRPNTSKVDTGTEETMEGATCIVQEEFLHMAPDTYIHPSTSEAVTGAVADMEGATCTMQEEFPILVPPPLNTVKECDQAPPNLFNPEHLELIFDIISYMVDQLHRDTLINNRIDMLFDAFSNAPAKQRCPTCAQPFVLQPNDDILHSGASDDRFHGPQSPANV